jgi:hypothetical protein
VGTLSGVFAAEAIYLAVAFHAWRSLTPAVLAAAALAFLPRTPRHRRVAGLATVVWTAAAGLAYGLLWLLL